ncbi:MAG: polysaccharide pyruvyl transferase family protein [Sulfurimonas sp.]|nr:polysaccharide pyruvyl transferase family protein [Sulfurimonas sp.]
MKDSPNITFMTTLGVNVGDEFIREGICSFVDQIFPKWQPFYVNKHDTSTLYTKLAGEQAVLTDKFRDSDIIIQAGAPVYWKIGESTSYNVAWAKSLWFERIFRLGPEKPILNVAAGACQPYPDFATTFLNDPRCLDFACQAAQACRWTSVRDVLAAQILMALNIPHAALPCAAFHAARRMQSEQVCKGVLGINFMPIGGHFKLRDDVDGGRWRNEAEFFITNARKYHTLFFIAHDEQEKAFMELFRRGDEQIFIANDHRAYMSAYAQCSLVIANRVHGAVCAAGFGNPAIIIGNDTRIMIGDLIGIENHYIADVTGALLLDRLGNLHSKLHFERERLLAHREESAQCYVQAIRKALEADFGKYMSHSDPVTVGIGTYSTLEERSFYSVLTAFAQRNVLKYDHDRKIFYNIWTEVLQDCVEWKAPILIITDDADDAIPWFLISMGADVTLATFDHLQAGQIGRISERLQLNPVVAPILDTAAEGDLPFGDSTFQVVLLNSSLHLNNYMLSELNRVTRYAGSLVRLDLPYCDELLLSSLCDVDEFARVSGGRNCYNKLLNLDGRPRILLPRFDTFGDIVLFEGFVEALKLKFPQAELVMLVRTSYVQLSELFPIKEGLEWITVPQEAYKPVSKQMRNDFLSFIHGLMLQKWDLIIFSAFNMTWLDEVLSDSMCSIPQIKIGPAQQMHGGESGVSKIVVEERWQEQQKYAEACRKLFGESNILLQPTLRIGSVVTEEASSVLASLGLTAQPFAVCVPGGTHNQQIKAWSAERFADVMEWVYSNYGLIPLLIGHKEESTIVASLAGMLKGRGLEPAIWLGKDGELPLLAGLLAKANVYVGNDTGPMHIAAALGTPVVGVFGGGTFPRFLPLGTRSFAVVAELPCFGCYWDCEFGDAPCLQLVTVEAVKKAVSKALAQATSAASLVYVKIDDSSNAGILHQATLFAEQRRQKRLVNATYCNSELYLCKELLFQVQSRIDDILGSYSWRLTAPLRWLLRRFSR